MKIIEALVDLNELLKYLAGVFRCHDFLFSSFKLRRDYQKITLERIVSFGLAKYADHATIVSRYVGRVGEMLFPTQYGFVAALA